MSDKFPGGFLTAGAPAGFSVAFDGTGDYLTVANSAVFNFGSGDFTLECWVYIISKPSTYSWFIHHGDSASAGGSAWSIGLENNTLNLSLYSGGTGTGVNSTITTWNYSSWVHVAATRSGNTIRLFANGELVKTDTYSSTLNSPSTVINVGSGAGGDSRCNGYISNARVLKGTAVYTAAFTPPTQLFPITNTSLLTCQSPTLVDNSTNALTVTAFGDAKVSNFTPFAGYTGFNPALGAAAGGVWTLDEAAYYQQNRIWPIYDPYFNQTTLMLHGNGTNGAQNNTFLDSSTNNFTITRNGNTTQGSFSPFSQTGWSNFFSSSANYLVVPANSNFIWSTGARTYEAWVYVTSVAANNAIFALTNLSSSNTWELYINTSSQVVFRYFAGSAQTVTTTGTVPLNTWAHVAFVYDGTSAITIYINGVSAGTGTKTGTPVTDNNQLCIGRTNVGTAGDVFFSGYISNARFTTTTVYTSNFTPSNAPLTAVTGTTLLTCQGNRFVDNSANNFALTVGGTPSVQAFSPFVPAYITPTTYSNWFNKSTGYLTVPSNTAFNFSTSDFTIEAWIWFNQTADASGGGQCLVSGTTAAYPVIYISTNGGTTLSFAQNSTVIASGTIQTRAWNHVAVTRSGSSLRFFVNGILAQTATYSTAIDFGGVYIGAQSVGGVIGFLDGAISNLRMLKGTALYTANFTPPAEPLTNITNTSLLTCQSSTFIDNSSNAFTITATGNVQPVTSPTPFPAKVDTTTLNSAYSTSLIGGSYYGNAVGDYLSFTDPSNVLDLGGIVASFECWYYPTALGSFQNIFFKYGSITWSGSSAIEYAIAMNNGAFVITYNNGGSPTALTDPTTRVANQWYHVAVATDTSNNISLYVNGVRVANATNAITKPTTRTNMYVGSVPAANEYVRGYISGLRFITGSNAYNAASLNIGVPPLTPPTNISNTSLLLNYTNGAIFDNTAKNVLETVGGAAISSTQAKYGTTSMYFNGTNAYLYKPADANLQFGSGNFTIECWIYIGANFPAAAEGIVCSEGSSFNAIYFPSTTGVLEAGIWGVTGIVTSTTAVTKNAWNHVALVRNGNTFTMYVNGIGTSATYSSSLSYTAFKVGVSPSVVYFNGYIDDLRITKGVARYITNFTPPTSQLQDQ